MTRGVLLEDLTWLEAEQALGPETVVVVPLGAAAKEHGPHLLLKNDLLIANYLRDRVLAVSQVVVAPTIGYHYYPAFVDYPGSTSLALETARDLVVQICQSLATFGPRRFYILNTGVSTERALDPAMEILEADGLSCSYTHLSSLDEVEDEVGQQEGGTHADEIETSMMLYIAPDSVDMSKAISDYHPGELSGLSRQPGTGQTYSATGVFGDATLATREKGEAVIEVLVATILAEIDELRSTAI